MSGPDSVDTSPTGSAKCIGMMPRDRVDGSPAWTPRRHRCSRCGPRRPAAAAMNPVSPRRSAHELGRDGRVGAGAVGRHDPRGAARRRRRRAVRAGHHRRTPGAQVDFTRPYAIFHEGVLIRRGDDIHSAADLVGRRVAAIENSTNMTLAETFDGRRAGRLRVAGRDDVYADMLAALQAGMSTPSSTTTWCSCRSARARPATTSSPSPCETAQPLGDRGVQGPPDALAELDGALGRLVDSGPSAQGVGSSGCRPSTTHSGG